MDEGKMRKYLVYAIGEISLVVIGILIALQVNTWNDVRKEREEEYLALKSLHEEFVESRELFEVSYQPHHKRIFDGMKYLLEILDAKRVNEGLLDSIYIHLDMSAMSSGTFEPSRGITNSLINSGNINIIRNDKLKSYLIKWNDQVINFQNVQRSAQDYKFTHLYPLISRITQLPSKLKRINMNELDNDRHGEVDLTLFQSKEFYNYLNQSWVFSGLILVEDTPRSQGRKIQKALDNIILLIEDELEE